MIKKKKSVGIDEFNISGFFLFISGFIFYEIVIIYNVNFKK